MQLNSKNDNTVLLFNLRLYLGFASVFFPLSQGPVTQRWIWIELCEYLQVRHGPEAFVGGAPPPSPTHTKKLNSFVHVLAMTA